MDFDVFNGDADGICALLQLRQAEPRESRLITGVKRDISLLERVDAGAGDRVTVLDISMDKNKSDLERLRAAGVPVFYADHHFPGDIPDHPGLTARIDQSADTCTALIINDWLDGAYAGWAVVGAFGDNMGDSARAAARAPGFDEDQLAQMENLGIYINYNGYGASPEDLHFPPEELFRLLNPYASPLDFISGSRETFQQLENGYHDDMARAEALAPESASPGTAVYLLPAEPWCRRVSGVFGNSLANEHPDRAHAIVTARDEGGYLISVRAPLNNKQGAADLCKQFPTGGGRAGAAGINELPEDQLDAFIDAFQRAYG